MKEFYQRTTRNEREQIQRLDCKQLTDYQLRRLNYLLSEILPQNGFYSTKFCKSALQLDSLEALHELPFTFKDELIGDEASAGFARI